MRFVIEGKPVPKGRPRFTRKGVAYTPDQTKAFEACESLRTGIAGPLRRFAVHRVHHVGFRGAGFMAEGEARARQAGA